MPRALIAFEPPDGGVAEHVGHLALGLPDHGWEIEVAGPQTATTYPRLDAAGVPLHRIPALRRGFGRPWRDGVALWRLTRLLREGGYELIHCHAAKAGVLGRLAARFTRTPAVYTPHCFGFVGDVSPLRRSLVPVAERALARRTAGLVCVCEAELAEAERHRIGSPDARHRIYNGCEPCRPADPPAELAGIPARLRVGTIAVFRPQKGLDVLIAAAPRILASVSDAAIAIVGDGPLRAEVERQAAAAGLLGNERFRFIPFTPPTSRYLTALDLFVLPSRWEAFPLSLLESLACGVPQVATDVGGTGEAVDAETGVLVPPRDPQRLAGAVIELLRDPKRREAMAVASTERWRRRFRLESMLSAIASVYREAIGAGR